MTRSPLNPTRIAFQGQPGAYSHLACRQCFPEAEALPCTSFEDAFAMVREGQTELAMIPIENSVAGRVADVHHLMPDGGLSIVGEHFQRVNHQLMAPPGTGFDQVRVVHSHIQALGQCRQFLRKNGLRPMVHADTAGAAQMVAEEPKPGHAAIASELAASIYGLEILMSDVEDAAHNTTRFLMLAAAPHTPPADSGPVMTTFIFRVRNVPAALYKALGGFATNGINMTKLESYVEAHFNQAQFYAEVMAHPDETPLANALEELAFFSDRLRVIGVYPASDFRFTES